MAPEVVSPFSGPGKGRGRRSALSIESADRPFFLAVSRAFLSAVRTDDRNSAVLYSRAMLAIMNRAAD